MRMPILASAAALALMAGAATAAAPPQRVALGVTLAPAKSAQLTVGPVARGEFLVFLKASSDGTKAFTLTQQRNGGTRFTVLRNGGPACEGAAGTLVCSGITTPATPAGHRWTFTLRNRSGRPIAFTLRVTWRPVASAG